MDTLSPKKEVCCFIIFLLFLACADIFSQAIPIKLERNKTVIPVSIGDIGPLKIVLDTGMPFEGLIIYNPDLKDSIKLKKEIQVRIPGVGRGEPSVALMDDSATFFVGDLKFKNQKIIVLQNDIFKEFPSDGIIGYSLLGHYATEINYDDNVMNLYEPTKTAPDSSWQRIPMYFKNNTIPWIDVSISVKGETPVKLSTYIDLAAGDAFMLLEKQEMKFSLPDGLTAVHLGRGFSGDIYGEKGKISKLFIGQFELSDVTTMVAPAEIRTKQIDADAIIGNDALRRFNLIFNYDKKMLYIKPNKYFKEKFE